MINTAALLPGTGAAGDQYLPWESLAGSEVAYHQRLPTDLQRAAPETYRSIRNDGVSSFRAWVLEQFPIHARTSLEFQHLFQSAVQGDYLLAQAQTES